jgi:hypothetical protein
MGKPNAHQLPEHLRLGAGGYYLDYQAFENGRKMRMREKLGNITRQRSRVGRTALPARSIRFLKSCP